MKKPEHENEKGEKAPKSAKPIVVKVEKTDKAK